MLSGTVIAALVASLFGGEASAVSGDALDNRLALQPTADRSGPLGSLPSPTHLIVSRE
jgi:hypothetical protein